MKTVVLVTLITDGERMTPLVVETKELALKIEVAIRQLVADNKQKNLKFEFEEKDVYNSEMVAREFMEGLDEINK
jgi:hypothetical protein